MHLWLLGALLILPGAAAEAWLVVYEPEEGCQGECAAVVRIEGEDDEAEVSTWSGPADQLGNALADHGAAVSGGLGGAGLAWLARPALLGLFSRLTGRDVLQHPTRRRMYRAIEAEPGIHLQELMRRLGTANGATRHHIEVLRAAGLVRIERAQGYCCLRPGAARADGASALRAPTARKALAALRARPGRSAQELAQELASTPGNIDHHLRRMQAAGLVEARREGRRNRWYPEACDLS